LNYEGKSGGAGSPTFSLGRSRSICPAPNLFWCGIQLSCEEILVRIVLLAPHLNAKHL